MRAGSRLSSNYRNGLATGTLSTAAVAAALSLRPLFHCPVSCDLRPVAFPLYPFPCLLSPVSCTSVGK